MSGNGFKSALVLSGGSARALSHLGVLEAMQRRNMKVDLIVGTSMGSVIGGLYAYYRDVGAVDARLRALFASGTFLRTVSDFAEEENPQAWPDGFFNRFVWLFRKGVYFTHTMLRREMISEALYGELMDFLLPDVLIEDLPVPFASVAMDLATGEEIVITKGPLRKAVAASSAIPGLLPAIESGGRQLLDGGWVDNVAAAPAIALGAHFVLAVDATLEISGLPENHQSAIETVFRCNEITRILLTRHRKFPADVLITPDIKQLYWADFKSIDRCIEAGRKAFEQKAGEISKKLALRRLATFGGRLHPARKSGWRHPFIVN